jgi:hypothetical protein
MIGSQSNRERERETRETRETREMKQIERNSSPSSRVFPITHVPTRVQQF